MRERELNTESGEACKHSVTGTLDPTAKRSLIATRAREKPSEAFNNLLHHISPDLVRECLNKTSRTSARGVDGVDVESARKHVDWLLPPIMKQVHEGRYEAPPVRRVHIPKSNGSTRPIGVPTVMDRALQAATAKVLNEIYEQDFRKCSFGFRPGLSCHNALATLSMESTRHRLKYALEVDIRDFFGSLDHEWMRKFLRHRISDERVLKLIDAWLKAGCMEEGRHIAGKEGVPQGGSISPLLANIYLHYVLDLWWEKKIRPRLQGKAVLIRYCDDCVPREQKKVA